MLTPYPEKRSEISNIVYTKHDHKLMVKLFFNFAESFCAFAECLRAALVKGYILPRAYFRALGKGTVNPSRRLFFADGCHGARQKLCRVPDKRLSAKRPLPRKFLLIPLC